MRIPLLALSFVFGATLAHASSEKIQASCTLTASGGDDSPQFLEAVVSCSTVIIPKDATLNIATRLNMTGLRDKTIDLQGTLRFAPDIPYWTGNGFFIPFQTQITFWILGGRNITLKGGGTMDGAGQAWYDALPANSTLLRPIILTIYQANDVVVENITMINSPEWHNLVGLTSSSPSEAIIEGSVQINESKNVLYQNITINAASTSSNRPANTDGWNIYRSDGITIKDSLINNGDDCVAFKPNATNVLVSGLNCNGSHGISVGSLGQFPGVFDIVENVTATIWIPLLRNVKMSNAENGARIKTWAGPNVGSGIVKNITFQNFIESKVDNPVIIDQASRSFRMQSVLSRFPRFFRQRSATEAPIRLVATKPPLFQRQTPWWARWTWGLIACDLFMTGSAVELTYNHWTALESDLKTSAKNIKGDDASSPDQYILRPSWQRISVCTAHMCFGAGIAAALLITQIRFVRTLAILPASGGESQRLFLQCAHNWARRGMIFPLSKCSLEDGRNSSELILRVAGERGHWYIGFADSDINGKRLTGPEACAQVIAAWNGKPIGPSTSTLGLKLELDERWKSGPVRRSY
ncbi:hypothetical protein C0995_013267 [Termitomyces sp. Mi166|nr:hypothetical protein C0995_013267 [Termitomyces sp. Mi166\